MHTPDFPRRCVRYALGKAGDAGVSPKNVWRTLFDKENVTNHKKNKSRILQWL